MKLRNWVSPLALAVALFAGTAAYAVPITSNPTLVDEGITFNQFQIALTNGGGPLTTPTNANQIDVATQDFATGIRISSGITAGFAGFTTFSDAALSYHAGGTLGVTQVGLSFTQFFLGLAVNSVTETVWADAAHTIELGRATVFCAPSTCSTSAVISLNGSYNDLYITKDINVTASPTGFGSISIVDQTYTRVPEPASLALFGAGLLGLGVVGRRRRQGTPAA